MGWGYDSTETVKVLSENVLMVPAENLDVLPQQSLSVLSQAQSNAELNGTSWQPRHLGNCDVLPAAKDRTRRHKHQSIGHHQKTDTQRCSIMQWS